MAAAALSKRGLRGAGTSSNRGALLSLLFWVLVGVVARNSLKLLTLFAGDSLILPATGVVKAVHVLLCSCCGASSRMVISSATLLNGFSKDHAPTDAGRRGVVCHLCVMILLVPILTGNGSKLRFRKISLS